ncbi:MAG: NAD(P)/FAD-dependent oxidoreductase [Nevskia sp.]|nr:NAD(P)/FAD-dependent oxidoreductase [Nevskia sp.]
MAGLSAVVIGAGMAGVLMGIRLKDAGVGSLVILEKGGSVGGTWRENTYPGLHCDFPSHLYRYSFDPNPEWSHHFSPGAEIRQYFENAARKFGVFDRIRFDSEVAEARWNGAGWEVKLVDGRVFAADVLISATGFLHVPRYPDIPGLKDFARPCFHTARWDHAVPLDGRRVGLVGTGSTATQVVCALANRAARLCVFQRTPQWVMRLDNPAYSEADKAAFRKDPALMEARFREMEQQMVYLADGAIQGRNAEARAWLERNVQDNLASVRDPVLRQKLTPDYQVGCKRLVMSPSFYESIQHPACELVTAKIERIVAEGVRTNDGGLHALDVLVLATGFDPQAYFCPVKLFGEQGRSIDEVWANGPRAYRSMTVPYMPNFFMIEGPFSPVGNVSAILIAEWQSEYIVNCIAAGAARKVALVPDAQKTEAMMQAYKAATRDTIWFTGGCRSWYLDQDGVPILYPHPAQQFEQEMRRAPDLAEYRAIAL